VNAVKNRWRASHTSFVFATTIAADAALFIPTSIQPSTRQ